MRNIAIVSALMVLVFASAMAVFVRRHSHFIADDFDHFADAIVKSLPEMLATRIDVHFVPFHQLASYLLFKLAPLNFDLALLVMLTVWLGGVALLFFALKRLIPVGLACLVAVILATSPAWLHILIWWSAAAHRLPYLLLQAAAFLAYLRYRDQQKKADGFICLVIQVLALGFYVKAILFPIIFGAIEICLTVFSRKLSRAGIKLCIGLGVISGFYVIWYVLSSTEVRIGNTLSVIDTLSIAMHFVLRLGAILLFLPVESARSEWMAGLIFGGLACWSIWRSPRSAMPIVALISLLLISFMLNAMGRGAIIAFPFAAMRYYSDEIFVVAIFVTLTLSAHFGAKDEIFSKDKPSRVLVLLFVLVIYPIGSYLSSRTIFNKAYIQHDQTHDFVLTLKDSLQKASEATLPPTIIKANLPTFVYGFMGVRKSMADIFGVAYPKLKWVQPEDANGNTYQIGDDGQLHPFGLSDEPRFDNDMSFPGWYQAEESHRWSRDSNATILFSRRPDHHYVGELKVSGPILGTQRVMVRLNGVFVSSITLTPTENCCEWNVNFPPALLIDGVNTFEFELPDAHKPDSNDSRILAVGIGKLKIN